MFVYLRALLYVWNWCRSINKLIYIPDKTAMNMRDCEIETTLNRVITVQTKSRPYIQYYIPKLVRKLVGLCKINIL